MEENVLRNKTKSLMKVLWSVMPKFHRFRDCNKTMYSIALGTGHWQSNRLPYSNGSPLFHLPISMTDTTHTSHLSTYVKLKCIAYSGKQLQQCGAVVQLFHVEIAFVCSGFCKGGEWDIGLLSREENTYGF
ncbi:hypothetical protein V6N13_048742 [Hibiscus sabdariffa]